MARVRTQASRLAAQLSQPRLHIYTHSAKSIAAGRCRRLSSSPAVGLQRRSLGTTAVVFAGASDAAAGLDAAPDCRGRYAQLVAKGELRADPAQQAAIDQLAELHELIRAEALQPLAAAAPGGDHRAADGAAGASAEAGGSWWARLFGGGGARRDQAAAALEAGTSTGSKRALYIWGGVGCGKTMVMDLFYESVTELPKRRCVVPDCKSEHQLVLVG